MTPNNPNPLDDVTNPTAILQGHNERLQRFDLKRSVKIISPQKRSCTEYVFQDQFSNWYLVYRTTLQDGETYDVGDWVKPSVIATYGGFNDDCLDAFRHKAFGAFNNAANEIAKLRDIASRIAGKLMEVPANITI